MPRGAEHARRLQPAASQQNREIIADPLLRPASSQTLEQVGKRCLDFSVAALALILLLPLMCLLALLIWGSDGHAPIYRHTRVGQQGRAIKILKFRSMLVNGDEVLRDYFAQNPLAQREWNEFHKLAHDPRVTPLGRILRKTSLDELPQLISVLKGDMSLVGPRPIVTAEIPRYGEAFHLCFSVTPGITGLWQVSGRSNCTYDERVALDLHYATHWRLAHDFIILIRTVPAVLAQRGSR
jgi:exopolysaccharide production protein ExoY